MQDDASVFGVYPVWRSKGKDGQDKTFLRSLPVFYSIIREDLNDVVRKTMRCENVLAVLEFCDASRCNA